MLYDQRGIADAQVGVLDERQLPFGARRGSGVFTTS
jgi:hypothetical protein